MNKEFHGILLLQNLPQSNARTVRDTTHSMT
jgi:hypothetical protein